ncbi:MAG: dihydropteroate synthase [Gemmatimonadota bacterium]
MTARTSPRAWAVRGGSIDLHRPVVMGVLNLTPDSFSDGGEIESVEEAVDEGIRMREQGADLLDVGGESSRPGARPVDADEEWSRIGATVAALACGRTGAGLVIMHMRGKPETMQDDTRYEDLIGEISAGLDRGASMARDRGVKPEQIVVDPGIGFGKSVEGNLKIIARSGQFCSGPWAVREAGR